MAQMRTACIWMFIFFHFGPLALVVNLAVSFIIYEHVVEALLLQVEASSLQKRLVLPVIQDVMRQAATRR